MVKNKIILILFFILLLIISSTLLPFVIPHQINSPPSEQPQLCTTNQTKQCFISSCNGTSTCFDGDWSSCYWEKVCTPGSRAMCIQKGCAYAVKTCNPCGTGYSQCGSP
ncbi:MAG: hypothetical protein ABID61_01705 [Candidatus Micrarchaeota archaeon]